jgi:hypothetical protein
MVIRPFLHGLHVKCAVVKCTLSITRVYMGLNTSYPIFAQRKKDLRRSLRFFLSSGIWERDQKPRSFPFFTLDRDISVHVLNGMEHDHHAKSGPLFFG